MTPFKTVLLLMALAALTLVPSEATGIKKLKLKKLLGLGLAGGALGLAGKKLLPIPVPIPLPIGIQKEHEMIATMPIHEMSYAVPHHVAVPHPVPMPMPIYHAMPIYQAMPMQQAYERPIELNLNNRLHASAHRPQPMIYREISLAMDAGLKGSAHRGIAHESLSAGPASAPAYSERGSASYQGGPASYQAGPASYQGGPASYQGGSSSYQGGSSSYQGGSSSYQGGSTSYQGDISASGSQGGY